MSGDCRFEKVQPRGQKVASKSVGTISQGDQPATGGKQHCIAVLLSKDRLTTSRLAASAQAELTRVSFLVEARVGWIERSLDVPSSWRSTSSPI